MSWGVISEMGYVAIETPDVDAAVRESEQLLGLTTTRTAGGNAVLATSATGNELAYVDGTANAVGAIGLRARSADALAEIRRRVKDAGAKVVNFAHDGISGHETFSFIGPEGWRFDIYCDAQQHALGRGAASPERFGHVNFHPRNPKRMAGFLMDVLDFRVSDQIGDDAFFLRCNSEHHGVALIPGVGKFHHHAWQFKSTDDIVNMCDRVRGFGHEIIWGPVRHGAGQNIAAYYVESTGAVVELYTNMEHIYDDDRPAVHWQASDNWYNLWSDRRPGDFRDFGIPNARDTDAPR